MSTEKIAKALANCEQGLSASEQATARENIGAQGALTAGPNIDIYNNVISTEKPRVEAGANVSVASVLDPQTRTITYTVSASDTTYRVFDPNIDGLVPASGENTTKFLRGDGSWADAGSNYSFGTGLTVSGNDVSVTTPVPTPGSYDAGKKLVAGYSGSVSWADDTHRWSRSIPSHEITSDDISNGYADIPVYIWPADSMPALYDFTWFLLVVDAAYRRGSTSSSLQGYATKIKVSWCDDEHAWQSNDNAHGSDPVGQLFEDIPASELARVGGYPVLVHPIRRVGGDPSSGVQVRGPSFRVVLEPGEAQAGDRIAMDGKIQCIRW